MVDSVLYGLCGELCGARSGCWKSQGDHASHRGKLFATKDYVEGLLPENYGHIHKLGTPRKPEPTGGERHIFQGKALRKKRLCAACSEPVVSHGSVCQGKLFATKESIEGLLPENYGHINKPVCKIISHKKCEGKVAPCCSTPPPADMRRRTAPGPSIQHMGSTKSVSVKQRSSLPRSFSLDHVMQRSYDLDLTYITERIISVFFPTNLEEQRYRSNLREVASMLRSKHEDNYLLFNLSKKRHDIKKLNSKVQDFFWPDCHAPPLDVICSICKAMEAWLNADPLHVVVLHCKGNQGKTGVVIASYMHYSKVSASVDQALSTLAMRKFCEDKVSSSLHPSQRRYINYFGGLLSGTIKISSDMLSLQCVLVPVIPALQKTDGGNTVNCRFSYDSVLQAAVLFQQQGKREEGRRAMGYVRIIINNNSSAFHNPPPITVRSAPEYSCRPLVKCYHKRCKPHEREVVFRLQFHTCTIHNTHLCFSKDQLDCAFTDERFPEEAAVEFFFSSGQDKAKGHEVLRKDPSISVDYDITDPLVSYDSYENLNAYPEDSPEDLNHTRGPLDGSLYARVKKKSTPLPSANGSPEQHGRLLSVSSDSGHSSAPTERLEVTPQKTLPTAAEREDLEKLLGGFGVNVKREAEPQYSQVVQRDEVVPPNIPQKQNMEGRTQNVQHQAYQEGQNQSFQTKVNGDSRLQYSPPWSAGSDEGAPQSLPLTSQSWDEQRGSPCETQWESQGDREVAILEEEMGQFGGLTMFPERRPLLTRHCSCRSGPNIDGHPNRNYFRPEGIFDPRGPPGANAVMQNVHYPNVYGEQDRRRLYRSLSEGPQHYPNQSQSPPKRGSLRENRQYMCHPAHETLFPPMCHCSHCQSSYCYPMPNMWPPDGGKLPPVQHFHREQLSLHLSQPYGQPSHDIPPPFHVPPSKMHYGFPVPHAEDSLHFNHFTDGGYGHAYPNFLHPSYLPTHCPPHGYNTHSVAPSMPSYNQPGSLSPQGSVSPIAPTSSAPRRMSSETVSAASTGELTPPQQQLQQDVTDHGIQGDQPSFQTQKPTAAAAPSVGCPVTTPGQSPLHTSTPAHSQCSAHSSNNSQTHSPVNGHNSDAFVYPHIPVQASTPITSHCQPVQKQHNPVITQNTAVQTQTSILVRSAPTLAPPERPALQSDHTSQPESATAQHITVQKQASVPAHSPTRTHVHFNSEVNTYGPVMQVNNMQQKSSPVQSQSPPMQLYNGGMSQGHAYSSPEHPQSAVRAPDVVQSQSISPRSPVQSQSTAQCHNTQLYCPTQANYAYQTPTVVRTQGAQTSNPKMSSIHLHNPGSTETPNMQGHTHNQAAHTDNTAQTHSTVHTQMSSLTLHSPPPKPSPQTHNTVHIQTATFQTFRNPSNQGLPVSNSTPASTLAPSSQLPSPGRPGVPIAVVPSSYPNGCSAVSQSPPHVTKPSPQMPANTATVEPNQRHVSVNPVSPPKEAPASPLIQYSLPAGSSCLQNPSAVPVSVTPPKKSTLSLPDNPIICHGVEGPNSPPLSPAGSHCDFLSPSPTPSFPISTAYYSGSPCPPNGQPPVLPEKCHAPATGDKSGTLGRLRDLHEDKSPTAKDGQLEVPLAANFVQDYSRFWYKPNISREQAIALLRGSEPGSFLIRDSNSFRGAYGLALKVASPPPNVPPQPCKDPSEQLVRHFLIETGPKGVKIKGSPVEPHFDLTEQTSVVMASTNMSTAADLLRQGAACSVLYLGSVDTESLTGPQAISKASTAILTPPRSSATTVHFKVSDQGVTLTDSQRKLFFRRHYPISSVTYCSADPQDRRWTNPDRTTSKVFGFVARKAGTAAENVCHLFAELDPEQPASAIVNFITKVMLGTQKR